MGSTRRTCRVVSSRDEPSGIWAISLMSARLLQEIVSRIKMSEYYSVSLDSTPWRRSYWSVNSRVSIHWRLVTCRKICYIYAKSRSQSVGHVQRLARVPGIAWHWQTGLSGSVIWQCFLDEWYIQRPAGSSSPKKPTCALGTMCWPLSQSCWKDSSWELLISNIFLRLSAADVFFTVSTHRYRILVSKLQSTEKTLYVTKKLSETRWSCRADATRALSCGFREIKEALSAVADDEEEKATVRSQADGLYDRMSTLELGLFAAFWNDILERFNATSRTLQDPKLDVNVAVALLKSLQQFVLSKRDSFYDYEKKEVTYPVRPSTCSRTRARRRNIRLTPLVYGQAV